MRSNGNIPPHPFAACKGVHGFTVMRDAWDAIQSDPEFDRCVPFRCRTCSWWHIAGNKTLDRLRAAGCLR